MQDELKLYQSNLEGLILERTKELQQALEEAEASKEKILDAQRDTLRRLGVAAEFKDEEDRKSTRLNSSHNSESRMPSSA
jgi:hypothetical protein